MLRMIKVFTCCLCLIFGHGLQGGIRIIGDMTHEKELKPGEEFRGMFVLYNNGDSIEKAKLYQTDYVFYSDGTNHYGEPGLIARSNADWVQFSPKSVVIPPRERVTVQFRVQVPAIDILNGTYWSILMVEGVTENLSEILENEDEIAVRTIMRYGVQMVTHIRDTGIKKMTFLNSNLIKEVSETLFYVDLENIGERWLRPMVWVEIFSIEGQFFGKYHTHQRRVYPGTSIRHSFDLSDVPDGEYKALVVADCGGDDLFGIQYKLQIE